MNIIQQLLKRIEEKNSWGKNELKNLLLELLAAAYEGKK